MNVFIMYMSGNTISIVPITMMIMMMIGPVKTLFNINTTFKALDNIGGGETFVYKFSCLFTILM